MRQTSYKPLNSGRGRRRGSTLIFVCLAFVALIGSAAIAVDYGLLVADANRMQRAADAAALGGANLLLKSGIDATAIAYDQSLARSWAVKVAGENGVKLAPEQVTFPAYNKIQVSPSYDRNYFFAPFLGFRKGSVTRTALAGRLAVRGVTRAVPLAVTIDDYNKYRSGSSVEYKLVRNQDTDFVPGTVTSLDLRPDNSGKSGNVFQEDLTYGYNGTIYLNQKIDNALTSDIVSQGAKLENAMDVRFDDARQAPTYDNGNSYSYPNYPPDDRRVMMIIVANPNPLSNNNPTIEALFFAAVYVESYRSPANKAEYIRFRIMPNYTYNSQDPNVVLGDDSTPYNGVSAVSLLQ